SVGAGLPEAEALAAFGRALGHLLDSEVSIVLKRARDPGSVRESATALHFALDQPALELSVEIEPQLGDALLCKLLRQAPGVTDAGLLGSARARGTLARLCVEAARNAEPPRLLSALPEPPREPSHATVGIEATLILDGRPYAISACLSRLRSGADEAGRPKLARLGALELTVNLLGAMCQLDRQGLYALAEGDAILPGEGWWLDRELGGNLVLAPEAGSHGVFFDIVSTRSAKLLGVRKLPLVEGVPMSEDVENNLSENIAEAVLDAPVLVRIEVASVSMSAAELAQLRPGDIIETDQPLGELVT